VARERNFRVFRVVLEIEREKEPPDVYNIFLGVEYRVG
jgi:hypothetical protein